jgi:hypothetical protein
MSILMFWPSLGQMKDKMVSASVGRASLRPGKLPLKANPYPRDATENAGRVRAAGLKKFEAEELLDWLEVNGRKGQLTYVAGKGFAIRSKQHPTTDQSPAVGPQRRVLREATRSAGAPEPLVANQA